MRIDIVPLFLGTGGHLRQDLPPLVEAQRAATERSTIHLHAPIGEHPRSSMRWRRAAARRRGLR